MDVPAWVQTVATVAVAIATIVLVWATNRNAKMAREITADAFAPVVTIERIAAGAAEAAPHPVVRFRNVGTGPALRTSFEVTLPKTLTFFSEARPSRRAPSVLGAGEYVSARLAGVPGLDTADPNTPCTVRVHYGDAYDREYESVVDVSVTRLRDGSLDVALSELRYQRLSEL